MKKKDNTVVIVGGSAGALIAREIFAGQYRRVLFLETYAQEIKKKDIVAASINEGIAFLKKKNVDYFIATGDNHKREENFKRIFHKTKKVPVNCVHSTAYISPSARMGFGNLICPYSVIHTAAVIGNNTIINTGTLVEHTCVVSDYAQVSPNATLCGYVQVGKFAFVGAGSVVIPHMKIGVNSVVAAGAAVTSDIDNNKLYAGVPAKYKKRVL